MSTPLWIADLARWAAPATAWMLTYAVHSTLLLGAAWGLTHLLGERRLALQETVWKLALVGGIATATLQLGLGVEPLAGSWSLPVTPVAAADRGAAVDAALRPADRLEAQASSVTGTKVDAAGPRVVPRSAEPPGRGVTTAAAGGNSLAATRTAEGAPASGSAGAGLAAAADTTPAVAGSWLDHAAGLWPLATVGVWLAVALALVAGLGVAYARLYWRLRDRWPVTDGALPALFGRLTARAGRRRVRLSGSDSLPVPIAWGVVRPEVSLPEEAVSHLSPYHQESILAHELSHLVRRDPAWLALGRAVEAVLFFQPLNRLARRRLQHIAELRCDDRAVELTGRPLELARCLTEVAAWRLLDAVDLPVPGMAAAGSGLGLRVRRLLDRSRAGAERLPRGLAVAAVAALAMVAFAAPGVTGQEPPPAPAAPAATPAAPCPHVAPATMELPAAPALPAPPAASLPELAPMAAPAPPAAPLVALPATPPLRSPTAPRALPALPAEPGVPHAAPAPLPRQRLTLPQGTPPSAVPGPAPPTAVRPSGGLPTVTPRPAPVTRIRATPGEPSLLPAVAPRIVARPGIAGNGAGGRPAVAPVARFTAGGAGAVSRAGAAGGMDDGPGADDELGTDAEHEIDRLAAGTDPVERRAVARRLAAEREALESSVEAVLDEAEALGDSARHASHGNGPEAALAADFAADFADRRQTLETALRRAEESYERAEARLQASGPVDRGALRDDLRAAFEARHELEHRVSHLTAEMNGRVRHRAAEQHRLTAEQRRDLEREAQRRAERELRDRGEEIEAMRAEARAEAERELQRRGEEVEAMRAEAAARKEAQRREIERAMRDQQRQLEQEQRNVAHENAAVARESQRLEAQVQRELARELERQEHARVEASRQLAVLEAHRAGLAASRDQLHAELEAVRRELRENPDLSDAQRERLREEIERTMEAEGRRLEAARAELEAQNQALEELNRELDAMNAELDELAAERDAKSRERDEEAIEPVAERTPEADAQPAAEPDGR